MIHTLRTVSPVDGRIYVERPLEAAAGINRALDAAGARAGGVGRAAA